MSPLAKKRPINNTPHEGSPEGEALWQGVWGTESPSVPPALLETVKREPPHKRADWVLYAALAVGIAALFWVFVIAAENGVTAFGLLISLDGLSRRISE